MQNVSSVVTHARASKTRVLLVEDNPGDADLTIEQLQDTNVEIVQFQTIQATLDWLSHSSCEAIILDLNLSDSRGLDTLRRLKSINSDAPTIVVSGLVDNHLRIEATRLGAVQVISKNDIIHRFFPLSVLYATEHSRAKEKEKLAQILDAMPDAVVVIGKEDTVKYANHQALLFFGRTHEEFIKATFPFAPSDGKTELKIQHPTGDRVGEMRVTELEWQGEQASLATIRDITEQRKLEIQLLMSDRLASLGTLSASIVHEINNPLLAALNNVSLATNSIKKVELPERDEIDEILNETTEALEQIQQIVRDVKLFSRNDEEQRAVSDVHRVLDSAVRMARNEVRQRARLIKEYGNISTVYASDSRLSQVFLNLLVNAAQAIPKGNIAENEIRIRTYLNPENEVVIEFKDTGAGIPPELQDQIFTPFFTTKPISSGTGLGLAICQRIINNLGGRISFESTPGKGTLFWVMLPSSQLKPLQPAHPTKPTPQNHVLIVDDDEYVLRSLTRVLHSNYRVTYFNNAAEAIQKISNGERFDAILSDMMMPTHSGIEFYHAVQAIDPEQAKRFIFMTGSAASNREFLEASTNPFIEKPFKPQELLSLLTRIIPN